MIRNKTPTPVEKVNLEEVYCPKRRIVKTRRKRLPKTETERVNVFLRLRPLNKKEEEQGEKPLWQVTDESAVQLNFNQSSHLLDPKIVMLAGKNKQYRFGRCFSEQEDNLEVFKWEVKGLLESTVEDGTNSTIMTYGQTGSGKTFTMLGCYSVEPEQKEETPRNRLDITPKKTWRRLRSRCSELITPGRESGWGGSLRSSTPDFDHERRFSVSKE